MGKMARNLSLLQRRRGTALAVDEEVALFKDNTSLMIFTKALL
jgi:hypothetical protein